MSSLQGPYYLTSTGKMNTRYKIEFKLDSKSHTAGRLGSADLPNMHAAKSLEYLLNVGYRACEMDIPMPVSIEGLRPMQGEMKSIGPEFQPLWQVDPESKRPLMTCPDAYALGHKHGLRLLRDQVSPLSREHFDLLFASSSGDLDPYEHYVKGVKETTATGE